MRKQLISNGQFNEELFEYKNALESGKLVSTHQDAYDAFRQGKVQVLTSCGLLCEGKDFDQKWVIFNKK